ncbi:PREDICTED: receptor-like protein 12 [Camelina sativa]|uniref:Receptor-like protein 12 n=1 Tax=Camelina sativa TaxID=90675 RepID=A0ABM1QWN2_CAMSA|nr:PREDICTED: receptor-like protein 12 [Camelina sativa]
MKAFLSNQKMSFLFRSICFLFLVSSFLNTFVSSTQHLCHSDQRDALLELKSEFLIQKLRWDISEAWSSFPKTESWVNKSDCCSWDGITCAANSGKVIGLDLSFSNLHGQLKSNSSLFRMRHLRDLNLAYNNFTGSPIPAEFDKLMGLERLNLSQSSLSGQTPIKLLQLTKLVSLDLSSSFEYSDDSSFLSIDESFLHLLAQNLRNLRELDMSYVNISSEIPHEFSNLRSLRSLHLSYCNLSGEFPSSVLLIPSLESIRLSFNPNLRGNLPMFRKNNSLVALSTKSTGFSGPIPDSISSLKHLTSLTLSFSKFSRKIPFSLGNLSHLSILDLGGNNFVGGNLKQLTVFAVENNKLNGNLPVSILNFTQLRTLGLSSNQFTGFLPPNISQFSKLESFLGGDDSFTGDILSSLLKIPSLTDIRLSYNKFSDFTGIGNISLFLPNLQRISIESRNFNKVIGPGVDLNVFSPLKQLYWLLFLGIPLSTTNITSESDFLPNLAYLFLPGCNITEFPEFIRNGRKLRRLDLSNNIIKGQVPDWLWRLPKLFERAKFLLLLLSSSGNQLNGPIPDSIGLLKELRILNLSSNAFTGHIPSSQNLQYFFGSKNNFTGEIPRSVCGLSSLAVLDLSDNNLNGSIPWCLETLMMSSLSDLNLRNNKLSGILPEIFQNAKSLITLDVSHNRLEGKIPASLGGCSALEVLNVGSNTFNDMFPFHLNSLQKLQVLVLRSNKFNGTLHNSDGVWFGFPQLKIIDVSYNDFVGTLPFDYFLNWTAISSKRDNNIEPEYIRSGSGNSYYSLVLMSKGVAMEMERILTIYTSIDFSGNQLHGPIPDSVGLLTELLILNLSSNAFTGHIPSTLANLTNLESLDLSQNKISGEIPSELGALSYLEVINISHNQLVGSIPQGTQFQRQNCSSYEGNPGLNGPSLKDVCSHIKTPTPPQPELVATKEEEESFSWMAAGLGFAPGVVFGLVMGYIAVSYKHEWFMKRFGRNKQQSIRTR